VYHLSVLTESGEEQTGKSTHEGLSELPSLTSKQQLKDYRLLWMYVDP